MRPLTLAKTAGGAFAAAAVGGIASKPAVESAWYRRLKKPGFQPPTLAFPIAWNILFTDIATVSASTMVMHSLRKKGVYTAIFPIDEHASWEKNAVTLRNLYALRERVRALEKKS